MGVTQKRLHELVRVSYVKASEYQRRGRVHLHPVIRMDRRMPSSSRQAASIEWEARVLRRLGFSNLQELDEAVAGYDDDRISRVIHGNRQGQLTRLGDVLLASLGEEFIERHPWSSGEYGSTLRQLWTGRLERLRQAGIPGSRKEPTSPTDD
jgi:putative GTP pyrophosphokinase